MSWNTFVAGKTPDPVHWTVWLLIAKVTWTEVLAVHEPFRMIHHYLLWDVGHGC